MSIVDDSTNQDQIGGDKTEVGNVGAGSAVAAGTGARAEVKHIEKNIERYYEAPVTPKQKLAQRNRRAMLELVKAYWIKGVLEKSLYSEMRIELGLEERAEAVEHPWDAVVQVSDQPNRTLPPGTKIVTVFDEMNYTLLILGEPGAGKTTMLLELARDSIARAEQDATQPIPVVFNLSSWTDPKQPIAAWLVAELNAKYNIPKKIASGWVEHDELLLLLDGLDEVHAERRGACVEAINAFHSEHGLMPLVVCSRIADYEALTTRLRLRGAVLLQPLTPAQIAQYLERASVDLVAVRHAMQHDTGLQELAQSPLILSIIALAYRGVSVNDLQPQTSIEANRQHLFDAYVQQMFKRRGADRRYSQRQTLHWLTWLAQRMIEQGQSIFLLERMQRSWVPTLSQRWLQFVVSFLVDVMFDGLVSGLVVGLFAGLFVGLFVGLVVGLTGGLVVGLVGGLVYGLVGWLFGKSLYEPTDVLMSSWKRVKINLDRRLFIGLVSGLIAGLVGGLVAGLFVGLVGGLALGLVSGLVVGLIYWLLGGLSSTEIEIKTTPNQGIQAFIKTSLVSGLVGGLVYGLVYGLIYGLITGLAVGLLSGIVSGTLFGGGIVIYHYSLRFVLYCSGYIPWNYVRFLDHAAERILLRKVGGGYIFTHRLLMEYFASLAPK